MPKAWVYSKNVLDRIGANKLCNDKVVQVAKNDAKERGMGGSTFTGQTPCRDENGLRRVVESHYMVDRTLHGFKTLKVGLAERAEQRKKRAAHTSGTPIGLTPSTPSAGQGQ